MFDQRAFIERVERANTAEFARLLALPTYEQEAALRAHFGDDCYQRLHAAALPIAAPETQRRVSEGPSQPDGQTSRLEGNVVLLRGFMGSELSTIEKVGGQGSRIWLNLPRLALGQIDRLSLAPNGAGAGFEVRATGILKSY